MIYNFEKEDEEDVPDLEEYKTRLAAQMLRSAFFQNEKKENFSMTRIPNIIAPALIKKQVNSDRDKETLFNSPVSYGSKTMTGLAKLISKNKINILQLDDLSSEEIKNFSKALSIKQPSTKSNVRLLEEIKFVCKMYAAGQGKNKGWLIKIQTKSSQYFAWLTNETKKCKLLSLPPYLRGFDTLPPSVKSTAKIKHATLCRCVQIFQVVCTVLYSHLGLQVLAMHMFSREGVLVAGRMSGVRMRQKLEQS